MFARCTETLLQLQLAPLSPFIGSLLPCCNLVSGAVGTSQQGFNGHEKHMQQIHRNLSLSLLWVVSTKQHKSKKHSHSPRTENHTFMMISLANLSLSLKDTKKSKPNWPKVFEEEGEIFKSYFLELYTEDTYLSIFNIEDTSRIELKVLVSIYCTTYCSKGKSSS